MRGRTLANSFVILDEAQNTTSVQMKMFLTRLGEGSRMVVTGDLSQIDLPSGMRSGLKDAIEIVSDVPGVAVVRFTDKDVVRHDLVTRIVRRPEAAPARVPPGEARPHAHPTSAGQRRAGGRNGPAPLAEPASARASEPLIRARDRRPSSRTRRRDSGGFPDRSARRVLRCTGFRNDPRETHRLVLRGEEYPAR
jgi:hypothetical protein